MDSSRFEQLVQALRVRAPVAVAFSGGVDSSFLVYAARAADARSMAIMAVSAFTTQVEQQRARHLAQALGVRLVELTMDVLADPVIAANPADRCYHCKKKLFTALREEAHRQGCSCLVDGTNADDVNDFRPGMRALEELSVYSPLKELGFAKAEIRALSEAAHLPTAHLPAKACLATRFPVNEKLTEQKLRQVERAEGALEELGYPAVRVRHHGEVARLELPRGQLMRAASEADALVAAVRAAGYRYVALDLAGYQMGSMNRQDQ